jgi:hypothetical protein
VHLQLLLPSFYSAGGDVVGTLSRTEDALILSSCWQQHTRPVALSWSLCLRAASECDSIRGNLIGQFRYEHSRASHGVRFGLAPPPGLANQSEAQTRPIADRAAAAHGQC